MSKKITPRGKWVLVKPVKDDNKETEHGILVPSSVEKEQKAQGDVIKVGAEVEDIKKGQTVIYGAYTGEPLTVSENGKETEYKLLLDEDIIAFVE